MCQQAGALRTTWLQGGLIAAIIMASLSRLGGNAHVAKRILKLLSTHLPGRVVLRLGAAKWQAQATGGEYASATGSKASLQWAASRLWAAGEPPCALTWFANLVLPPYGRCICPGCMCMCTVPRPDLDWQTLRLCLNG